MPNTPHDAEPFYYTLHNEHTDPTLRTVTAPLPEEYRPHINWPQRFSYSWKSFWRATVRKINQFLNFVLVLLSLLLVARFLLTLFGITTSLFAQWVYLLSWPLILPFDNMVPVVTYSGYRIDASTLVALAVYFVARLLLSGILKILVD